MNSLIQYLKKELPKTKVEWFGFCCIWIVVLTIVGFIGFFVINCIMYPQNTTLRDPRIKSIKYDVEFKSVKGTMFITNKSDKTLRVHCAWQSRGESTIWIKTLKPGHVCTRKLISSQNIYLSERDFLQLLPLFGYSS